MLLYACPVYDPPFGTIRITNLSSETLYVYATCSEILPKSPALKLFFSLGDSAFDETGNKITDTIYYPNYRIEADSFSMLGVWGTPEQPKLPCNKQEYINLFFILESTMRNNAWLYIVENELYKKKIRVTKQQLDSLQWEVKYIP